jgi:hypothetical protein
VSPAQDRTTSWDISTSPPMKQEARFPQRVQEAAPGPVVTGRVAEQGVFDLPEPYVQRTELIGLGLSGENE